MSAASATVIADRFTRAVDCARIAHAGQCARARRPRALPTFLTCSTNVCAIAQDFEDPRIVLKVFERFNEDKQGKLWHYCGLLQTFTARRSPVSPLKAEVTRMGVLATNSLDSQGGLG